jgi:hypothetical protein
MPTRFKTIAFIATTLLGTAGIAAAQSAHYDDSHYNRRNDDYRYDDRPPDNYGYQNRSYDVEDYRYDDDGRNRNYRAANLPYGLREARMFGFRDGESVARQDLWSRKPFDPNPRGRFDDADNGYRPEFGSKPEYREQYIAAYRQAYRRSYLRNDRY